MDGITYIYNVNGKPVGIYDYTNGRSVPIEENEPNPAAGSPIASKPDPGKEISFWSRFLNIASSGGPTGAAAACVSSPLCDNVQPNFTPYKDISPNPSQVNRNDYNSENGVTITWEPESAVPNCDGNFDHQRIVVHFRDGDQTFYPDLASGKIKIEKNFKYEPKGAISGDFIYYNPNAGAERTERGVITLYPPISIEETASQCYAPAIEGNIERTPPIVRVGEPVKIFKSTETIVKQCDEGDLAVSFIIGNEYYNSEIDEQNNYYTLNTFQQPGWTTVTLKAAQGSLVARKDIGFSVEASVTTPQASILAPSAAKSGEQITLTALGANEALFDYTWNFGDGSAEKSGAVVTKTYTLPSGKMATMTVMLTVSDKNNPAVQDVSTQKITVVPPSVSIPSFTLNIPYAAEEDAEVTMSVNNLSDSNWQINWFYGDGSQVETGQIVHHTYVNPAKYNILCRLTSTVDSNYVIETPFTITIVPHGNPVPNLEITPGMGKAPLNVVADASNSYATDPSASIISYSFNWGDGSAEESGTQASRSHTFACASSSCAYTVRVTVTDSNGSFSTISAAVSTWQ